MIVRWTTTRRSALALVGGAVLAPLTGAWASDRPTVTVTRDPSCGCCGAWVQHIIKAGYPTIVREVEDVTILKAQLSIPEPLWSCHTSQIGGYVLEGHVPAPALARLIEDRPAAVGLAVAGMPLGSPGMEGNDTPEYEVVLFGRNGMQQKFMTFRGERPV